MREDMAKVIVERPRYGGYCSKKSRYEDWNHRDWDDHPRQIGLRKQWRSRKYLNENLSPLLRFLYSRVGRPWTEVYGEIRERINMNSAVQLHIWQHVKDFVCQNAYKENGNIYDPRGYVPYYTYVDPDNGLLCKIERRSRKRRSRVFHYKVNEYLYCRRIEGRWKKVVLKNLPIKGVGWHMGRVIQNSLRSSRLGRFESRTWDWPLRRFSSAADSGERETVTEAVKEFLLNRTWRDSSAAFDNVAVCGNRCSKCQREQY